MSCSSMTANEDATAAQHLGVYSLREGREAPREPTGMVGPMMLRFTLCLAALLALRWGRLHPNTFAFAVNDYGLAITAQA